MLIIGILSFSLVLGYMIGASNSPVIGAFFSALSGFAGIIFGAKHLLPEEKKGDPGNFIGLLLLVLSLGLFFGAFAGEKYRTGWFDNEKELIWNEADRPVETREALDWIAVCEKLTALGYSMGQIRDIYQIRAGERAALVQLYEKQAAEGVESFNRVSVYDRNAPFHAILKLTEIPEHQEGLRSSGVLPPE